MKTLFYSTTIITGALLAFESCTKTEGCTDKKANNFDVTAQESCPACCTYGELLSANNGSVIFYSTGQYMPVVTISNGNTISAASNTNCTDSAYKNHVSLPQGNYSYTANSAAGTSWKGSFSITAGICTSVSLTSSPIGTVQFSTNNTGLGAIKVTMDDSVVGTVTPYVYSPSFPGPGFDVSANQGTHSYTAYSANGQQWTGSIKVVSGQTTAICFTRNNMSSPAPGYCNVVFYSTSQPDYLVYFNKTEIGSGIVASNNVRDVCSQNYVVSVVVPFGTYNWFATTSAGNYFSGSVAANSNGCITVQF